MAAAGSADLTSGMIDQINDNNRDLTASVRAFSTAITLN
jgi:hypothetical protein